MATRTNSHVETLHHGDGPWPRGVIHLGEEGVAQGQLQDDDDGHEVERAENLLWGASG